MPLINNRAWADWGGEGKKREEEKKSVGEERYSTSEGEESGRSPKKAIPPQGF